MIDVRQVAHVCVLVEDLDRTREFYGRVLGLTTAFEFTKDGAPFGFYLNAGGRSHVEVFRRGAAPAGTGIIDHLCLEVADLDAAIAHVRAEGVEPVRPKKRGVDGTWQCWLADPDGTKIELFEYTDESAQFTGGTREVDW